MIIHIIYGYTEANEGANMNMRIQDELRTIIDIITNTISVENIFLIFI